MSNRFIHMRCALRNIMAFVCGAAGTLRAWLKRGSSARIAQKDAARAHSESEQVPAVDPYDPFPEPVRVEITDIFDLHTIPPRQVRRVVAEYLKEAHGAGFRSVRIIHGKGIGVQREIVRAVLAETPFVESWTDAPAEAGGWGATIAHLKRKE